MSIQHYFTVKNEMTSQYVNSIDEIVESITNNTSEMLRNKQSIASYSVSLIEEDLSQDAIKNILRQPEIVKVFNIAGVSLRMVAIF